MRIRSDADLAALDFSKGDGLLPVVTQHARTGEVLMTAYASREALERTLATGEVHYWSRSRDSLWRKGESSGNVHRLVSLHTDCDRDSVLALVEPAGPTCHTGAWTCFEAEPVLPALAAVLDSRRGADPKSSYTARLLSDRNLRLKKLGEEAVELATACADRDGERIAEEAADLIYHAIAACLAEDVKLDAIIASLGRRLPVTHEESIQQE